MAEQATLSIKIWTHGERTLPEDVAEAMAPHLDHVSRLCAQGYSSGDIVDDDFRGWWSISPTELVP